MELNVQSPYAVSGELLEALRAFPMDRTIEHCGVRFVAAPFDMYADCPQCGARLKLRSFSAMPEIEDVFDAVFEWMNQPGGQELANRRQAVLADDES